MTTKTEQGGSGSHLRITVVLLKRQVAALDRLRVMIRLRNKVSLSRRDIIEAIIASSSRMPRAASWLKDMAGSDRRRMRS